MTNTTVVVGTRKVLLLFGYTRWNKYSIAALLGVLEKEGIDKEIRIMISSLSGLHNILNASLRSKYELVIVAISLMSTQLPLLLGDIRKLVESARKVGAITVVGGPHATGDPYGSLISLGFDVAFLSESERSFTEFIRAIVDEGDPLKVRGTAFWDGERVILNGRPVPIDLNEYPPFSLKYGFLGPIEITRGCPFACKYCQVSYMFGTRPRHRRIDNLTYYALELIKRGLRDIRFISPNSFGYGSMGSSVNYSALEDLVTALQEVRKRGGRVYLGSFPSEVRPDFVEAEVVKLIRDNVDNKRIIIGAQSGSDRVLKLIGRSHSADDVLNAVALLRQYGFGVDVDYIFGLPGETAEDCRETINHIAKVIGLGARVHAHVFLPLPGTPLVFDAPGKITHDLRRELFKLLGRGLIYGQWVRQEMLASEIDELRRRYVIIASPKRVDEALNKLGRSELRARPAAQAMLKVIKS
ncbi:MAG: TIGR04013 family B12-binding domain/radical SAM domain-containing protein [Desulfurococcales archaeon]|nr:TIGR04013 family B12-binding domain/radical SAM domain-containing protein [Desulfurococcales archaeon]